MKFFTELEKKAVKMTNILEKHLRTLAIRTMQIKTTMTSHLIPVRMAIIQKSENNKQW